MQLLILAILAPTASTTTPGTPAQSLIVARPSFFPEQVILVEHSIF